MIRTLAHVFNGIPHGEVMIPDEKFMEKSPLTQVIEQGGNQDDIPVEGGQGNAVMLIQ
ncbi:MAG: hypothetical protein J7K90_09440 [Desulfuromusa sp.]|nr:hypothetical protein [Desulfuromusa sp.]